MTHRSSHSVLLRGISQREAVEAVGRRLEQDGYVPVKDATSGTRITFLREGTDVLVSVNPNFRDLMIDSATGWLEGEWAEHLAEAIDCTALAIGIYEDGPGCHVTRFAPDEERIGFALEDGETKISAAILGRPKPVTVKGRDGESFGATLTKALALPKRWLDLWNPAEGETVVYRRRFEPPVLPKRAKPTGFEPAAAIYRGRGHAVGHFAFGAEADLDAVANVMSELVRAFVPADGLNVRVTRGAKSEVLPSKFSRTASIKAAQLARGGSVELTAGPFFDHQVGSSPVFWIANDPAVLDEGDAVPLHFGFSMSRPGAEKPELALAHAMGVIAEVAAGIEGCLAAVVTAQGAALTLADTTLPYETLAGTAAKRTDGHWLRAHARSPGWRTLVPRARVRDLARPPPDGLTLARCPSGVLVQLDDPTPFAVGETAAIERWLLPAFG